MEALALGTPLVTTDCDGASEYCIDRFNCLMVPVGDCQAMAAAVGELCKNKELRETLVDNGKRTARENFSWEPSANALEAALFGETHV